MNASNAGTSADRDRIDAARRRFLAATAAGVTVGLAGCGGEGVDGDGDASEDGDGGTSGSGDGASDGGGAGPGDETVPRGGTLEVGLPQRVQTLNPLVSASPAVEAIVSQFVASGVTHDPVTHEVRPQAFTDWTVENADSGEPDVYVDVRDGLTWNDGEPFDVDDVLFTYRYLLEQDPSRYRSRLDPIRTVEAADDWDLHLALGERVSTWETDQLGLPLLPEHRWPAFGDYSSYSPGDAGELVGLGWADELAQYEPEGVTEVRLRSTPLSSLDWIDEHPQLRTGGPFLDAVRFRVYENEADLLQALLDGDVDTLHGSVEGDDLDSVREADRLQLVEGHDPGISYVGYNMRRTPFDDVLFRQALNFLWDEVYWVERLQQERVHDGDFVLPPGYAQVRPETHADVELLDHPATDLYTVREASPGVPDYDGIRTFLEGGQHVTGEPATAVGQDYPGSLLDVRTSITSPLHDYQFGEVQSEVLREAGVSQELYVNGQTIPEILGRPITYLMYPPETSPELTQADEQWMDAMIQLGLPVEREVQTFNSTLGRVFEDEDFDLYHASWSGMDPRGVGSLDRFHSDEADDHREGNDRSILNNAVGYGLFDYATADDLIDEARTEMDPERRDELVARIAERIYLDSPYMVYEYDRIYWPVDGRGFGGFLEGVTDPGGQSLDAQLYSLHRRED